MPLNKRNLSNKCYVARNIVALGFMEKNEKSKKEKPSIICTCSKKNKPLLICSTRDRTSIEHGVDKSH